MRVVMTEEKFFEKLREDAARLRYSLDDAGSRLSARVRERVRTETTVSQMLARWFRPITASFAMLALVAVLSLSWVERRDSASSTDTLASNSLEITVDGDTYTLAE